MSQSSQPQPSWSSDELAALRVNLKHGSSLLDTARALRREPGDVEAKIAELYPSLQRAD
jgi:hypothetical protein